MNDDGPTTPPLVPHPNPARAHPRMVRFLLGSALAALRVTMLVSPRPSALLVRKVFARTGGDQATRLSTGAPTDVRVVSDVGYGSGSGADERVDLYLPPSAGGGADAPPVVMWIHGGAWVGGSKDELSGWFRRLADAADVAVAAISYSLAPESTSPTPLAQAARAARFLADHGDELGVDTSQLFVGGDSAGAQIAAQLGAVASSAELASRCGLVGAEVPPLRGLVLCCGPYDVRTFGDDGPVHHIVDAVMWAYSGTRRWRGDERFLDTMAVVDHVSEAFPATFVTVGNADPLEPQTDQLQAALAAAGVETDALRFEPDHQPALGHEYQFDVRLDESSTALSRIAAFLGRHRDAV
jgi:acetyl esterase/lipase